ncbi:MAG: FadR family transcriptional regulator [Desulfohalobiaceae bacterium]|nr:FadR family transcriptional regulator [Desulfohalobiaceae bacterium]
MTQFMFQLDKPDKITDTIIAQIRSAILEGKLIPGDKLPSEKELTEQFQTSKQTIRESLRVLEHMGLLEIRKGSGGGAFVVEVDVEFTKRNLANFLYSRELSLQNLTEVRKIIEPHAASHAARHRTDQDLARLKTIIDWSRQHYRTARGQDISLKGQEFHRIISQSTGNPLLVLMIDFVESLLKDFKDTLKLDAAFSRSIHEAHEKIYQAILEKDPERAAREMYTDVVNVESQLVKLEKDNGRNNFSFFKNSAL